MPAVGVVSSAGALCRDHCGSEWMLWGTLGAKGRAVMWLLDAAENLAADADSGLECGNLGDIEDLFGIVTRELRAQPVAAQRDGSDAAPLAVADFEDLANETLCGDVAASVENAGVLVFDGGISTPCRISMGSNPVITMGT